MQKHDVLDPFMTYLEVHPDFNASDDRRAIEQLATRQGVIMDWLNGETGTDAVLDCIEEQGLNAAGYAQSVSDAVDQFYRDGGNLYVTNESGILLPAHCYS